MRTGYSLGLCFCLLLSACSDNKPVIEAPITPVVKEEDQDPKLPMAAEKQLKEEAQDPTYIHIGSFQGNYFYEDMLSRLEEDGYKAVITAQKRSGERKFKTIKLGPFPKKQAEIIKDILIQKKYPQDMYLRKASE